MELDKETIRYVFTHCSKLLTLDEQGAYTKFYTEKEINEGDTQGIKQLWVNFYIRVGKLKPTYPESTTSLLKDGIEAFEQNTVLRVLSENPNHPLLNFCPECGKLARTPLAKQCRFCKHDWH